MKKRAVKRLSGQERTIKAITAWQSSGKLPQLTCGKDSKHRLLEAVKDGKAVALVCPDCDYRQTTIPPNVIQAGRKMTAKPPVPPA